MSGLLLDLSEFPLSCILLALATDDTAGYGALSTVNKLLYRLSRRPEILAALDLTNRSFTWRQLNILHEIASAKYYGFSGAAVQSANYILGAMYWDSNDYINAHNGLSNWFDAGGRPLIWLSRKVCFLDCITVYNDFRCIKAIIYSHTDTCTHIRVSVAVTDMDGDGVRLSVTPADLKKLASGMCEWASIVYAREASPIVVELCQPIDCNSERLTVDDEYSVLWDDYVTVNDVYENMVEVHPFRIMEAGESIMQLGFHYVWGMTDDESSSELDGEHEN